nr:MAG TPA: hypothetical protein [Caudoviricetes sp.]
MEMPGSLKLTKQFCILAELSLIPMVEPMKAPKSGCH